MVTTTNLGILGGRRAVKYFHVVRGRQSATGKFQFIVAQRHLL